MALDFLSAPATSTGIERLFSHSGLIVTKHRHALKPESIQASTVLQSWLAVGGIVPRKTLVKSYNTKQSQKKDEDNARNDLNTTRKLKPTTGDMVFENALLFMQDALMSREFSDTIKQDEEEEEVCLPELDDGGEGLGLELMSEEDVDLDMDGDYKVREPADELDEFEDEGDGSDAFK
ncbi:hypothetical protein V5O48_011617 [Marasmius crinis-equi]|uniref:HAT C-terminal dimerisation domain-containing protein n=1 Tax=Marasmius crinis-equi TaxID=585013 RepID=A0ABR3F548_9AGAR